MPVDSIRQELSARLPDYRLIRDVVAGARQMKKRELEYLPSPDPLDTSKEGKQRYKDYINRAVFYPATGRTLRGLLGLVFGVDPAIEIPTSLEPIKVDAAGDGLHIDQQAQLTLMDVLMLGRRFLYVDYPETQGPTTVAQARAGNVRPTIISVPAENVINWRVDTFGARKLLTLAVIKELYIKSDDGFTIETDYRYRVLRLIDGTTYVVELYEGSDSIASKRFTPTDGKGKPLAEIPGIFVGATNNDPEVDDPPLLDLADLNKHHYINSADYEESVFMLGQPTPVFAGLTKQWVNEVFRETVDDGHGAPVVTNKVRLGSRAAVPLPVGGSAELLQVQPNSMAFEAMEHKEKQMIALGAKLVENTGTQQTATEASLDAVMDNSVLATAARNVSAGYVMCLRWANLFITGEMVDDENKIDYKLNTDFGGKLLTAQDRQQIITAWQNKAITYTEMRWNMRRTGIAYLDDKEAKEESEAEREESTAFETEAAAALAGAVADATPDGGPPAKPAKSAKKKPPVKA